MKIYKLSLILVAAVAVVFGLSGISFAFHSGGVAECTGCHQMHNSNTINLTVAGDDSSTCLTCHGASGQSSYHVASPSAEMAPGTPPNNEGPGGDFGWLNKTYYPVIRGSVVTNFGQRHGHNIVAAYYDNGYLAADPDNTTAPGGTFSAGTSFSCVSCHDQHGKGRWTTAGAYSKTSGAIYTSGSYGSLPSTFSTGEALSTGVYRLLRAQDSLGGVTFPATPPVAVVNSTYNRSEFFSQTRTAYGSGMSDFCGACHPDMHSTSGILRHPTNRLMNGVIQGNYNGYVKSGNMTGSAATSYLSLVPFEEGVTYSTAHITTLTSHAQTNNSVLNGPSSGTVPATATVMCLSCHRAHASAWENMLKWDPSQTTIVTAGAYPTGNSGQGYSLTEASKGYYDYNVTKFSAYQRQLCNKCHAKD
jgi:predicted CXXCH cytochrome family protein